MSEHLVRVSRLKELQTLRQWDDAELARQCGRRQQQVYAWYKNDRTIGEKLARSLEESLKLPRYWLDERPGHASTVDAREGLGNYSATHSVDDAASMSGIKVPVLHWDQLLTMLTTPNAALERDVETLTTFAEVTPTAKFVRVADDSMEPVFQPGDHVLLDPALAPRAGDTVLVKLPSGEHFLRTFKPRTAHSWEAAALNTNYQALSSLSDAAEVVAVMVEHRRYRRP